MNDLVIATIRTAAPAIVGAFVILLADRGITLDDATIAALGAALIGIATAVWYAIVRVVAKRYPIAEKLLGSAKKPTYKE